MVAAKDIPIALHGTSAAALADAATVPTRRSRLCFLAPGAPKQEIFAVTARALLLPWPATDALRDRAAPMDIPVA